MAVAHFMAIAIFFVRSGVEFKDLGADYYTQFNSCRATARLTDFPSVIASSKNVRSADVSFDVPSFRLHD
jgi:hypothetical protein